MKRLLLLPLLALPAQAETKLLWDPPTAYVDGTSLDPSNDLASYRVYRDGILRAVVSKPVTASPPPTSYTDTTKLAPGTYRYYVTAFGTGQHGESGPSNMLEVIVTPAPTATPTPTKTPLPPPNAPSNLKGQ